MSTLASSPHHTGFVTCFQIQVLAMPDQQSLSLPREYLKQHKKKFPNFCPRYGQCPCCKASSMFSRGSSFNFTGSNDVSLFCLLIISESIFMAFLINICAVKIKLLAKLQADVFYLTETWWCISSCQRLSPLRCWPHLWPCASVSSGRRGASDLILSEWYTRILAVWLPFTGWAMTTIHFIFTF